MYCWLQHVHNNGNGNDIRAIRKSMMEYLTDTATARKDRFTEVLQDLMKNINKPTEKEKMLHDMVRYLCKHAADPDGLIDIGNKLLASVPKSRNTSHSNNPHIWAKKTSKAVQELISVILERDGKEEYKDEVLSNLTTNATKKFLDISNKSMCDSRPWRSHTIK